MKSSFTRAALLAGVITLGAAAAATASAQTPPPGADGAPRVERRVMVMGGPGRQGMHGPGMGMHGAMDPEKHAQHLRDVLQLRPDQEGALKAFIASMTPPAAGPAARQPMDMPTTTPERLAMMEKKMAEHQVMAKKHHDAIRAFYGQLTPAQQKAFDALHLGMGMGRHGPGERGMRMMHRGGPGGPDEGADAPDQ
ncbi:MAG: Spy/CpxP family protein refolding chaperone [Caulobacter sp.]|nr:Spy/CpxP family protein refolding chaperone [Caulobacter sp.]